VSRSRVESWSLTRSLTFLAAVFALAFGAMVPAVVAASASSDAPIVLCSGGQLRIVSGDHDPTGGHDVEASLTCAMALLGGPAALPTPEPLAVGVVPVAVEATIAPAETALVLPPERAPPRPPSTAPPSA